MNDETVKKMMRTHMARQFAEALMDAIQSGVPIPGHYCYKAYFEYIAKRTFDSLPIVRWGDYGSVLIFERIGDEIHKTTIRWDGAIHNTTIEEEIESEHESSKRKRS